jgi:hypothetical protein
MRLTQPARRLGERNLVGCSTERLPSLTKPALRRCECSGTALPAGVEF